MVRDMETLQTLKDGSHEQARKLTKAGHKLAALIADNLSTESTKTTIELNLAVLKITHEVTHEWQLQNDLARLTGDGVEFAASTRKS